MKNEFDDLYTCPQCGHKHDIEVIDTINGTICEANTSCNNCNRTDSWVVGYYMRDYLEGYVGNEEF